VRETERRGNEKNEKSLWGNKEKREESRRGDFEVSE